MMRRILIPGAAVIAGFGAVCLLWVTWWTDARPVDTSGPLAPDPPPAVREPLPPAPSSRPTAAQPVATLSGGPSADPAPPIARPRADERTRPAPRLGARDDGRAGPRGPDREGHRARLSFRRELILAVRDVEQEVASCSEGAARPTRGDTGETVFTIALESEAGVLRVKEVRLDARGTASEAALACAQARLRGKTIPAPSADPGRRLEVPLVLRP